MARHAGGERIELVLLAQPSDVHVWARIRGLLKAAAVPELPLTRGVALAAAEMLVAALPDGPARSRAVVAAGL